MSALDFTSPLPFASSTSKSTFKPVRFNLKQSSGPIQTSDYISSNVTDDATEESPVSSNVNKASETKPFETALPLLDVQKDTAASESDNVSIDQEKVQAFPDTPAESTPNDELVLKQQTSLPNPTIEDTSTSQLSADFRNDVVHPDIHCPAIAPTPGNTDLQSAVDFLPRSSHQSTSSSESDDNCTQTATYSLDTMTLHEVSSESESSGIEEAFTDDDPGHFETVEPSVDCREVLQHVDDAGSDRERADQTMKRRGSVDTIPAKSNTTICNNLDSVEGTIKPTSADFVLPPPPPTPSSEDATFTSHATFKVTSPHNYDKQNFTSPSWNGNDDDLPPPPPINDDFPLPPPPADLPVSPPVTSPTTPSFVQSEKPKGFRSVARPTSKPGFTDDKERVYNDNKKTPERTKTSSFQRFVQHADILNLQPKRTSTPNCQRQNGYVTLLRDTRKLLIKPAEGGSKIREETTTNYTLHGKPFASSHGADVKVTPEPQLPEGAVYQTTTKEGDVIHTDTYFPVHDQNDSKILERTKTTTVVQAPHHEGMGPVSETGVPCALRTTVDDSKHWYKNMFKQMHKVEAKEDIPRTAVEVKSPSAEMRSSSADSSYPRHSSFEPSKPKKVGRIFDYQPAEPYVVENKPSRSDSLEEFSRIEWNDYFEDVVNPPKLDTISDEPQKTANPVVGSPRPQQPASANNYKPNRFVTSKNEVKDSAPEPKRISPMPSSKPKSKSQPTKSAEPEVRTPARAKFDFAAQTAKEFPMKKSQTVIITRQVDSNWYMVQSVDGAKSGIVPVSYVEIISGTTPEKPLRNGQARAKFDYEAGTNKELSFKKGDEIILLKRVDENWYKGKLSGAVGILPAVYVEVTLEPESPQKKEPQAPPVLLNAPSVAAHSRQSSAVSQASSDEPDERERKQRAAFLANTVVKSSSPLHARDNLNHREDVIDAVLKQNAEVTSSTRSDPPLKSGSENLSELDQVVESLSSPAKGAPSAPVSKQLAPPSNIVTPSIPSYPSSNVSTQPSSPQPASSPSVDYGQVIGTYVALYAYEAGNDDELDLLPGDVVKVVETCDDGWYVGTCQRTGVFGTFPGNYVSLTSS